jgi:RNA 3'-terminal phosphate cyclase (ATP)
MLKIDGSLGEGGGQVLRSCLALSALTGTPFEIEKIRANRKKPGLMRQHLTAAEAMAKICGAEMDGATPGSQRLRFRPGAVRPGEYAFAVGTAGSASLVLQTVLPSLLVASAPSHLIIEGGTHNPMAPPFEFLERSFLSVVNRMGPTITARLEKWGFYPAGGGRLSVDIEPCSGLQPITMRERGPVTAISAEAVVANLPVTIAQRELDVVREALALDRVQLQAKSVAHAQGRGNVVTIEVASSDHREVFTAFGAPGLPAAEVATTAAREVQEYLSCGQPVSHHLADQLLIALAMSGGGAFRTGAPSQHARTNMEIVGRFLPNALVAEQIAASMWEFRCGSC